MPLKQQIDLNCLLVFKKNASNKLQYYDSSNVIGYFEPREINDINWNIEMIVNLGSLVKNQMDNINELFCIMQKNDDVLNDAVRKFLAKYNLKLNTPLTPAEVEAFFNKAGICGVNRYYFQQQVLSNTITTMTLADAKIILFGIVLRTSETVQDVILFRYLFRYLNVDDCCIDFTSKNLKNA